MYVYMCVYMNTHTHKIYGRGSLVTKSCPTLVTPWTVAHQGSLTMGFPRKEYWSGLPFPSPGDLPSTRIKPRSPVLQAVSLLLSHWGSLYVYSDSEVTLMSTSLQRYGL